MSDRLLPGQERPGRIVVADDSSDIRNLISLILTNEGYEVLSVDSGGALLESYQVFAPDLVLLDIMMPHLSGFEVLAALRADEDPKFSSLPVVMITAKSLETDMQRALELGANSYLVKPFRAEELKSKVAEYFGEGS